jgi:hypothetical protein
MDCAGRGTDLEAMGNMKKRPKDPAPKERIRAFRDAVSDLRPDDFVDRFEQALQTVQSQEEGSATGVRLSKPSKD